MANMSPCISMAKWEDGLRDVAPVLAPGGRLELVDDQTFFPYGDAPEEEAIEAEGDADKDLISPTPTAHPLQSPALSDALSPSTPAPPSPTPDSSAFFESSDDEDEPPQASSDSDESRPSTPDSTQEICDRGRHGPSPAPLISFPNTCTTLEQNSLAPALTRHTHTHTRNPPRQRSTPTADSYLPSHLPGTQPHGSRPRRTCFRFPLADAKPLTLEPFSREQSLVSSRLPAACLCFCFCVHSPTSPSSIRAATMATTLGATPMPVLHTRPRLSHAVPHLPAVEYPSLYRPLTTFPEFYPRVFKAGTAQGRTVRLQEPTLFPTSVPSPSLHRTRTRTPSDTYPDHDAVLTFRGRGPPASARSSPSPPTCLIGRIDLQSVELARLWNETEAMHHRFSSPVKSPNASGLSAL
ncbi:hypothetical protein K438DRAFT_1974747 [Mycena galopus ATCC 62051]|nr:hypothetical protein K438DRAFT_1974747 [Mycena galopus ATCC 62051]